MKQNLNIKKLFTPEIAESALFFIIILSVPYIMKNKLLFKGNEIIVSLAFVYIISVRVFQVSFRKIIQNISSDEFFITAICILAVIAGFLNNEKIFKDIEKPVMFFLSYIGISSFAKTRTITENTFIRILILYIIVVLVHTFIEYIVSFPLLFNYLTSKISYRDYCWNSWNLLYPNYNYFARTPMVGMMASLSLCFYYFLNKSERQITMLFFILSVFFGLTVLLTFSRTSIFASAVYFLLLFFYFIIVYRTRIRDRLKLKYILIGSVILIAGLLFLLHFNFIDAVIVKTQQQGSTHRFNLWESFLEKEKSIFPSLQFFLGHGFKQKNSIFFSIWSDVAGRHVHNNFLFIWYNYGLITMILFIIVLIKLWISNFKIIDKVWFVYFIPLSYMCVAFFETLLTKTNYRLEVIFFFIFLILPYNMYLQGRNNRGKEIPQDKE